MPHFPTRPPTLRIPPPLPGVPKKTPETKPRPPEIGLGLGVLSVADHEPNFDLVMRQVMGNNYRVDPFTGGMVSAESPAAPGTT